jgi:hypothetical protein
MSILTNRRFARTRRGPWRLTRRSLRNIRASISQLKVIVTSGLNRMQHCLGGQACNAVKNGLIAAGMTAGRINTISHGKESPFCTEHNEA